MCEFISWIEMPKGQVLFLTDKDITESHGRRKLEGAAGNDWIGHGAIRAIYDLPSSCGVEHEDRRLWEKNRFPEAIREYLTDPKTLISTWGECLRRGLQIDDAAFIDREAPPKWRDPIIALYVVESAKNAGRAYHTLGYISNLLEKQRAVLIEGVAKSARWAYYLLRNFLYLSKRERAVIIEGLAKSPGWAYQALLDISNLSEGERTLLKRAQQSA